MILLLDNYDSFTWNLVHALGHWGVRVEVQRNDALSVEEALAHKPQAIVISPGPCDPDRAGISTALVQAAAQARIPLLGVCLGHQALGAAFGGRIIRAEKPMHGKISAIRHTGAGLFADLPQPLSVTRYHSLIVERASLPDDLHITAESDTGEIMALEHESLPLYGVQFHPESIATKSGGALLRNFLHLAGLQEKEPQ